jgi:hypothetical protein
MIALDLDNTIVCYDRAFLSAAASEGLRLPAGAPPSKGLVKSAALAAGGDALWTRIQGVAYGEGMVHASLFPGCREFIDEAFRRGEEVAIVSHKSEYPASGLPVNLRKAADDWLARSQLGLGGRLAVHYCDSRAEKVARVSALDCRVLVDDLPEVYQAGGFPARTTFVLFDPAGEHLGWTASARVDSWSGVRDLCFPPS